MLRLTQGDITTADAEALVNTVNCMGVSGRGIALQFKKTFPDNFKAYAAACKKGDVEPGRMFVFDTGRLTNPRFIINFPTKRHWKGKSRIEDIEHGLVDLVRQVQHRGVKSLAVPPLGSGLGGLDWKKVRPLITDALAGVSGLDATVFEPSGSPERTASRDAPRMTPGRATLVGLMQRYLRAFMDPSITLLEIHKLMYFMQTAGEDLKLKFMKAPYGPYAENLRHVLNDMEGHYVSGYLDGGDDPDKQIELVPGAVAEVDGFLAENAKTRTRFDRVVDLVGGFETPFGLELLASVHWVATKENAQSPRDAIRLLHSWNPRKKQFSGEQVELAWTVLEEKAWLKK